MLNKKLFVLLTFALLLFFSISAYNNRQDSIKLNSQNPNENKRVLVIFSYDYKFPTLKQEIEGISAVFDTTDIHYDVEFLDSKRFLTEENAIHNKNHIGYKLKNSPSYDAVLSCDEDALNFVLENDEELFANIPIVFCAINDVEFALSHDSVHRITGKAEVVSIKETIELMINLYPESTEIYAISDASTQGKADLKSYKRLQSHFKDIALKSISLNDICYSDLKHELKKIPPHTPILYLAAYCDKDGESIPFDVSVEYINKHINSPLFHLWLHGLHKGGMIGGKVINLYEQTHYAAKLIHEILNGKDISSVKVSAEDNNVYMFNYDELKKFNIDESQLPKGSIILNKPESFFTLHQKPLIVSALIILIMFLLILVLSHSLKKEKKALKDLSIAKNQLHEKEKILTTTNSFFETTIKYIPMGVFIKDVENDLRYTIINDALMDIYQGFNESYLQKNDKEIVSSDIAELYFKEDLETINGNGKIFKYRRTDINGNQEKIYETYKALFRTPDNHKWIIGLVADITENENKNMELKEAQEKAVQSDKLKSAFLANMSHEIRTPLNAIVGFSNLVCEDIPKEEKEEYAKLIEINSDMLLNLINEILDISKIESGSLTFYYEDFDLATYFNEIGKSFKAQLKDSNIEFIIENPYERCIINSDKLRLAQVITNFVTNSIKYTTEGYIKMGYGHKNGGIYMYVEDTGCGIPEDKKSRVFDRFDKLDSLKVGTGLGLTISKVITEYNGGKIGFESTEGKGSTFWSWKNIQPKELITKKS